MRARWRGTATSHSSPDGASVESRIRRYYPASTVGETLLWHAGDLSAAQALKSWLGSPEHRALLLGPSLRDVGLAAIRVTDAPGAFRGLDVTILVARFGTRYREAPGFHTGSGRPASAFEARARMKRRSDRRFR